ncbi:uncharacterized protein LOC132190854 [Corylus avellana]|uniref:uncharacterized protein LOC132190854 n=1 Tax=Corylus avellana TaxID=13451 RepID=UPI00286C05CB|nr:uncharacterized protein LOC132190854 [Corylus avellana]
MHQLIVFALQQQGLAFCGHDESKGSSNQGNFLELLRFLAKHNEEIDKVVLDNALENHQMIAPHIQRDIANAAASETLDAILKDLGDSPFAILVDESHDISAKEQLAIVLRYVDKRGHVIERSLVITHVRNTTAVELKKIIDSVLSRHNLSISRLRGQGYDGASNMRDDLFVSFNKENLLRLAQLYSNDFSTVQLITLDNQLETYIFDKRSSDEFATLKGIGQLAEKLVETKKDVIYPLGEGLDDVCDNYHECKPLLLTSNNEEDLQDDIDYVDMSIRRNSKRQRSPQVDDHGYRLVDFYIPFEYNLDAIKNDAF